MCKVCWTVGLPVEVSWTKFQGQMNLVMTAKMLMMRLFSLDVILISRPTIKSAPFHGPQEETTCFHVLAGFVAT
jgi:hypothetical protein